MDFVVFGNCRHCVLFKAKQPTEDLCEVLYSSCKIMCIYKYGVCAILVDGYFRHMT